MVILVVNRIVGIGPWRIQLDQREVLIQVLNEKAGWMCVPFRPIFWEQGPHRVLILYGKDGDQGAGVRARHRHRLAKHRANLLEANGRLARLLFARIAYHYEIRAADFDPVLALRSRKGKREQESKAKNNHRKWTGHG